MKTKLLNFIFLFLIFPSVGIASEGSNAEFPLWTSVFFAGLLLSIAVFPLINSEWWGKRYGYVSIAFAVPAAILVISRDWKILSHVLQEYVSFIILLGSLFVVAGGHVFRIGATGTPKFNFLRSEERRLGQEVKSPWPPHPYNKNKPS